jgi:uncharacterized protein YecE (DUF72 family)
MNSGSDNILFGTSGWSYEEWVGPFYSKTDKSKLRAYSRVFKTAEIDSTFYRYPSKGTVMGWTRYSPEGFVYSAKLPRLITHDKKLSVQCGIEEDLQKFIELMDPLRLSGKLGCILIQLPPKFHFHLEKLEDFFKILPTNVRFAVEFRDCSWMRNETWSLLEEYHVAYTIVDEPLLPPEIHITSNVSYFRWHGRGDKPWYNYCYSTQELEPWISKLNDAADRSKKTYAYFNNHYHGYAVENCLEIMEMMGAINPIQVETKGRIENYMKGSAESKTSLENFIEPKTMSYEDLLRYFVPAERLHRAEKIPQNELNIQKQVETRVEATIKDYYIVIDVVSETISHDCADWDRLAPIKKMCKHVAKLFLSMNKGDAERILEKMLNHKDKWQFLRYSG